MTPAPKCATATPRTDDLTKRVQYLMHVYKIDNGDILYREMSAAIANELTAARADAERLAGMADRNEKIQRDVGNNDSANAWRYFAEAIRRAGEGERK